jgi:cell pole-organizing protein PopZ
MSQAAKMQEPSMEEILASIRRIISDEETPPKPAPKSEPKPEIVAAAPPRPAIVPPPPAAEPAPAPATREQDIQREFDAIFEGVGSDSGLESEPDILDLTEEMKAEPIEAVSVEEPEEPPVFQTIDGQPDVFFSEAQVAVEPEPAPEALQPPEPDYFPQPQVQTVAQAYVNGMHHGAPLMSPSTSASVDSAFSSLAHAVMVQNGRTIEDLVCDMLRPMLKTWLDDNLPGLVERLVRAEIERVSRGR